MLLIVMDKNVKKLFVHYCSFDISIGKTTKLRIPMQEGSRVLVDNSQTHILNIKSVCTGQVVQYGDVEALGRADGE